VFGKIPKPNIIDCYPENELYFDVKKKLITKVLTLPEVEHQKTWLSMIRCMLLYGKVDKAEVVKTVSLLFREGMGKNSRLQPLDIKKATTLRLVGIPGIEIVS